jgi:hypothetical protein
MPCAPTPGSPVAVYRECMHSSLNAAQQRQIEASVDDPELWAESLDHWRTHGWNPRNLHGILDFYQRGGPAMCRYCHPELQGARSGARLTPLESTLQAIQELREEEANSPLPTLPHFQRTKIGEEKY